MNEIQSNCLEAGVRKRSPQNDLLPPTAVPLFRSIAALLAAAVNSTIVADENLTGRQHGVAAG
jgi:hypothetical protein